LIEWPEGDAEAVEVFLSTAPTGATTCANRVCDEDALAHRARLSRTEEEFGLGHYEDEAGRAFTITPRYALPPNGFLIAQRLNHRGAKKNSTQSEVIALPDVYIPRGSRAGTAPRA